MLNDRTNQRAPRVPAGVKRGETGLQPNPNDTWDIAASETRFAEGVQHTPEPGLIRKPIFPVVGVKKKDW